MFWENSPLILPALDCVVGVNNNECPCGNISFPTVTPVTLNSFEIEKRTEAAPGSDVMHLRKETHQ